MAYGESNGHVVDDVTWSWTVKVVTRICFNSQSTWMFSFQQLTSSESIPKFEHQRCFSWMLKDKGPGLAIALLVLIWVDSEPAALYNLIGMSWWATLNWSHHHHHHHPHPHRLSSSSFIFKTRDMSKSIQRKQAQPGTKLYLRLPWEYTLTRILNTTVNKAKHTIYEKHKQQK